MIDLELAFKLIDTLNFKPKFEETLLKNSLNKVLAEPIIADRDYPPFNRAAMDGIAVNLDDFADKNFTTTIIETIYAGKESIKKIKYKECYKIMTGASVPDSCNAIVPFENLTWENDLVVSFNLLPNYFNNIAKKGEDLKKDSVIYLQHIKITPSIVGILASLGYHKIKTIKAPKILIISTGDELVEINQNPSALQIRSSSQHVLKAMFNNLGVYNLETIQIKDNQEEFKSIIKEKINTIDLVVTTGGVSAGDNDFIPFVYETLEFKKIFHKVTIKPGKPVWMGWNKNKNCLAFGLPGNPISTQIGFILFIKRWITNWFGIEHKNPHLFNANSIIKKNEKLDVFFPCNVVVENNSTLVKVIENNGSGDFISSGLMDGFLKIPKGKGFTSLEEKFEWFSFSS